MLDQESGQRQRTSLPLDGAAFARLDGIAIQDRGYWLPSGVMKQYENRAIMSFAVDWLK